MGQYVRNNKFADLVPLSWNSPNDTILNLIISEVLKMILKNKLTKETIEITYPEFRKRFAEEIQGAFESYRKTQLNKYSWNFKDDNSLEFNFYFQLQWNFNNFANSVWYIEKI